MGAVFPPKSLKDPSRIHGQMIHADSDGVVYGIGYRRHGRHDRHLTHSTHAKGVPGVGHFNYNGVDHREV